MARSGFNQIGSDSILFANDYPDFVLNELITLRLDMYITDNWMYLCF